MPRQFFRVFRKSAVPVLALSVSLAVAGCGMGTTSTVVSPRAMGISGLVHGGQNPVSGATIQLWKASTTGYASAATQTLTQATITDSQGNFTLPDTFPCSAGDQMYISATQGNPGLGTSVNNAALTMLATLGDCANLGAKTYIVINEVTTVATAYALAQFAADYQHIGTSATNTLGLKNAFLNAQTLASYATGLAAAPAANQSFESGKLYALADAIAPCVNSNGSSVCTTLFTGLSKIAGKAPTDTFTAALSIAQNPGVNIIGVWNNITGTASPFPTTLTAAPHDWTMSLTVTGGGISAPTAVRVDANGVVWAADYYGGISAVSPQGTTYTSAAYANTFTEAYGLAIDTNGHVWATCEECGHNGDSNHGSVIGVNGFGSSSMGSIYLTYADPTINYPESLFADSNGHLDIANYASGTVTVIDQSGNMISSGLGAGTLQFPVAIYADATHGVWLANQESTFATHVGADGTILASPKCCAGADGVTIDKGGNAWVANYWTSSVSEVSSTGTVLVQQAAVGGLFAPSFVGVDGAQNIWATNYHGASISEIAGSFGTSAAGTAISPSTGYGLDAALLEPFSLAIDQSGNVWVANYAKNNLVMFFGLATPTANPTQNVPALP